MENKISNCKKCGAPTENQFELVTLKTMVDRGFRKNKYYQAMGDIIHTAICDDCIDEFIAKSSNSSKHILKLSLLSLIVFIGCIVLFLVVPITAFRVFCAIIAGITVLAFLQEFNNIKKQAKEINNKNEKENRNTLAVKLLSKLLPDRHNDAELAYVDAYLIKKGDLNILAKEYGFSYKKLVQIKNFLKEGKDNQQLDDDANHQLK